jgi:hypothetical protein
MVAGLVLTSCAASESDSPQPVNGTSDSQESQSNEVIPADPEVVESDAVNEPESPAELLSEAPTEALFSVECEGRSFSTFREAWVQEFEDCDAVYLGGTPTEEQQEIAALQEERAVEKLSGEAVMDALGYVHSRCAQSGPENYGYFKADGVERSGQLAEFQALITLCPDHPDSQEIKSRMKAVAALLDGPRTIFDSGRYRIGREIEPGTYVSRGNDEGCYWERLDRNGNIISNGFTNGSRVQVTIAKSDFEFYSTDCNTWKRS